jgi:ubiquinone/menaquinone biosynthesis C-methylase UbiE
VDHQKSQDAFIEYYDKMAVEKKEELIKAHQFAAVAGDILVYVTNVSEFNSLRGNFSQFLLIIPQNDTRTIKVPYIKLHSDSKRGIDIIYYSKKYHAVISNRRQFQFLWNHPTDINYWRTLLIQIIKSKLFGFEKDFIYKKLKEMNTNGKIADDWFVYQEFHREYQKLNKKNNKNNKNNKNKKTNNTTGGAKQKTKTRKIKQLYNPNPVPETSITKNEILEQRDIQRTQKIYNLYVSLQNTITHTLTGVPKIEKMLDFGAGSGNITKDYSRVFGIPAENIYGLDLISHYGDELPPEDLQMFYYDGKHIPFNDRTFDLIISHQVMHHVENIEEIIVELKRILRPNGIILFREHNCEDVETQVLIDIEHALYREVIHPQMDKKYLMEYPEFYRSLDDWMLLFASRGFTILEFSAEMREYLERKYGNPYKTPTRYCYFAVQLNQYSV